MSWQKVHTCPCNLRPGAILVPEVGLLPEIVSRAMPSKHIVRTLLHTRGGAIVSYHHLQQPSLKHMPGDFTSQPTSVVRVSKVHMAFEHKGRVYIMMEHGTNPRHTSSMRPGISSLVCPNNRGGFYTSFANSTALCLVSSICQSYTATCHQMLVWFICSVH